MRTNLKPIALVLGLLLCAPMAALAEGESLSQMNELESRIMALEDRLALRKRRHRRAQQQAERGEADADLESEEVRPIGSYL